MTGYSRRIASYYPYFLRSKRNVMRRIFALALLGLFVVSYPVRANEPWVPIEIGKQVPSAKWTDYQGREWSSNEFGGKKAIVYAFIGTQCPLAKLYSSRLVDLESRYRDQGIVFVAVDPNVQDSLAEMAAHAKKFSIEFPFVKDPDQSWADRLGVTRTPEVCVVNSKGLLVYRGRIDDQYGIGYMRDKASAQDLVQVLDQVLAGKEVEQPITKAAGCLIGRKQTTDLQPKESTVTYSNQVSRLLQSRCISCHRDSEIGPMDLTKYEDASAWANMILEVVHEGRMPPWHANPAYGRFANDRRLSQEEVDILQKWVDAGAPRGNIEDEPPAMKFTEGWQLASQPDIVVPMSDKPFKVPAKGDVRYQYFVADPKFTEDMWVNGMEIVPGNRAVVHHILVFIRDKQSGRGRAFDGERGFLAGYVPGTRVERMPQGMAKRIPANSELIFQVHYTPIGTEQLDLSKVAFWYAAAKELTHEVITTSTVQTSFRIPPKDANYKTSAMQPEVLPDCELLSMSPHMHLRGKSFRYTAVYPDGDREILLDIPKYDFNWQTEYRLSERKRLPEGTRIFCEATFDNSEANLNNPNPKAWVTWGDQTYEEMMIGYFHIAVPIDPALGYAKPMAKAERMKRPNPLQLFKLLDTDGDGKLLREEVPKNLLTVFDRLDKNSDKVLELAEVSNSPSP